MRYVLMILAVAGIIVSSLALQAHYSTRYLELPCDINSVWSCGLVNHSRYAVVFGVPVALIGILGYVVLAVVAWLRQRQMLLGLALIALGFALYLTNIEWHVLQEWCIYCVCSQLIILTFTILAAVWWFTCRCSPAAKVS